MNQSQPEHDEGGSEDGVGRALPSATSSTNQWPAGYATSPRRAALHSYTTLLTDE